MSKNFWQKERSFILRGLIREYKEEGYDIKEARHLANIELNEVMEDKEDFVSNIWKESFEDD